MCLFKNVFCRKINAPLSHFFPPQPFSPWVGQFFCFALAVLYFCACLFCFGDRGWLCRAELFWPSRCLWPRSIMAFPFRAWPITSQGATDVEHQAGEIEWEENQPFGASKMIRFSTGVKVCMSESPSPCSPSMSPMFSQDISLMLGRKYLVHTSECKDRAFYGFSYSFKFICQHQNCLGYFFVIRGI